MTKDTDLTPLPLSVTLAENVALAPMVAPSPGSIDKISGGLESPPTGLRVGTARLAAATECP